MAEATPVATEEEQSLIRGGAGHGWGGKDPATARPVFEDVLIGTGGPSGGDDGGDDNGGDNGGDTDDDGFDMSGVLGSIAVSVLPPSAPTPPAGGGRPPPRKPSALSLELSPQEEKEVERLRTLPRVPAPGFRHTCSQACGAACEKVCETLCVPCAILCSYGDENYGLLWYLYIASPTRRLMTVILLGLFGLFGFMVAAVMSPITLVHLVAYVPAVWFCIVYGTPIPWSDFITDGGGDGTHKAAYWDGFIGLGTGNIISGVIGGIIVPVYRFGADPSAFFTVLLSHGFVATSIAVSIAPKLYDEDGPIER